MLEIYIPEREYYDTQSGEFTKVDDVVLHFEHSLLSLTEWEMKYRKPFLATEKKSTEEYLDYIRMMCLEELKDEYLSNELVTHAIQYMQDTPTATKLSTDNDSNSRRIMTSEVLYAYMANGQIPFSCDEWNIYNLLKLIGVLNYLNGPKKERSQSEIYEENRRLNRDRREKLKSKG